MKQDSEEVLDEQSVETQGASVTVEQGEEVAATAAPADAGTAIDASAAIIAALTAENKSLNDRFLRLAAEFDNYRKRSDREMQNYITHANFDLMGKLLPILDDLDRILAAGLNGTEAGAFAEGIALLQKNLLKTFQEGGLEPMQTIGAEFDPQLHDALLHVEVPESEPNRIVEEHKKGYFFKGKVLRHAQVVVSK
ncbi:MAG TPA: nucleotide exchange factor GrpE [bacterium]|nr:nucleotide exchange factor GrpE [bacterium]